MSGLRRRVARVVRRVRWELSLNPIWQFIGAILRLIWEYRWYSLAIFVVTIFQEFAALWPVNLLGDFIDRLESGKLGYMVWLLLAASLFYPGLLRANVVLRHKMFYETDFKKRVELVLRVSERAQNTDPESAGAAYTRAVNAVSGITNATYHILGSFTPVIIKSTIVAGRLLGYGQVLGVTYLSSLIIPAAMTILFNNKLRVLRDSQYSVVGAMSGAGIKAISEHGNQEARRHFVEIMRERKEILLALLVRGQLFLYARQAVLVLSQFLVVFLALSMRDEIGLTPGDFAKIIGYTTQVAGAFIGAASCLDAIISYSRAYHVYATDGRVANPRADGKTCAR